MIKHLVLFKLKDIGSEQMKTDKLNEIKTALSDLAGKINELKSIEVGINCNPDEAYDIALTTLFDNMDDLKTYAGHPDHLAAGKIIREVLDSRSCVDYEI